jgi:hypothetical protein
MIAMGPSEYFFYAFKSLAPLVSRSFTTASNSQDDEHRGDLDCC